MEESFDEIVDREAHGNATERDYEILNSNIPLWEASLKTLHQKVLFNINFLNGLLLHEISPDKQGEILKKKSRANFFASYVNEKLALVRLMRLEEQKENNKNEEKIKRKQMIQGYRVALLDIQWMKEQGYSLEDSLQKTHEFLQWLYESWDQGKYPLENVKDKNLFREYLKDHKKE